MVKPDSETGLPPQLRLAGLIMEEGSWGAFQKEPRAATRHEVEVFFDKVIAICSAESSFNPRAVNGRHKGLFQIDTVLHADKIKGQDIFDPIVNIRVAAAVSRESFKAGHDQFRPWTSYTSKSPAYLSSRGWGKRAYDYVAKTGGQGGPLQDNNGDGNPSFGVTLGNIHAGVTVHPEKLKEFFDNMSPGAIARTILDFVKKSAPVVGLFLLGLIALIIGFGLMLRKTSIGQTAEKGAKLLATKGLVS